MALIVPEESQRPYRFGMTLVCIGALFNWLGLADHHTKPVPAVRYIGVGLVASGAVLICMAMCFWMNSVRDDEDDVSISPCTSRRESEASDRSNRNRKATRLLVVFCV